MELRWDYEETFMSLSFWIYPLNNANECIPGFWEHRVVTGRETWHWNKFVTTRGEWDHVPPRRVEISFHCFWEQKRNNVYKVVYLRAWPQCICWSQNCVGFFRLFPSTDYFVSKYFFQRKSNTDIASHVWGHASVKEIITTANDLDMRWSSWSTWHNNRKANYGEGITYFWKQ